MDIEVVELEVTRKTKHKIKFEVDRSLEVYNREIEKLYIDDEVEFDEMKAKEIQSRKMAHLKQLRK